MGARPASYELEFEPDLERAAFRGRAAVRMALDGPARSLTLNAAELEILGCAVESGGREVPSEARPDAGSEELRIRLGRPASGEATVRLEFSGRLNDRLLGFYRSSYVRGGRTRHMATTQFEAADARRAFPCVDEPSAKATFDIAITAPRGHSAISNMPVASRSRAPGGGTRYRFARTPAMPTYLVYLGVGEFERVSGRAGRTAVSVVTAPGRSGRGRYALGLARRLLGEYERYFGVRYPLPKLDLIAVPDFAAGAMENWGAITFREQLLLHDPAASSTRTRQLIAEVVSHEIAHQWFGNLVTMRWWNDLWLNESFATMMATKFVDMMHPEWDMWDQFLGDAMRTAMGLDALESTHPIDVPVRSPSEIREIFDAISYDKGGCVLRMVEDYVSEPAFRRGLRRYLREHAYGSAEGGDLWDAVGRESGLPVRRVVEAWIRQAGFPLVEARRRGGSLELRQRRFLLGPGRPGGRRWPVPVTVGPGRRPRRAMLSGARGRVRAPARGPAVVNHGRRGFYRVRYDAGSLLDLKHAVERRELPAADRWGVQNDLFALCLARVEPVRAYLDFADAYSGETSYMVNADVAANLHSLAFRAHREPFAAEVASYALRHYGRILRSLGWDARRGEAHTDALLRGSAISALGRLGDGRVLAEAASRFGRFLRDPGSLPADLREPVYSLAAWGGGAEAHRRLARLHAEAGLQEERSRLLGAMCSSRDGRLLLRTLRLSLTPAVRSQDVHLPVARVAANPHGRGVLWPWLRGSWGRLRRKAGAGNPLLGRVVSSVSLVADGRMEPEIRRFFRDRPAPGTERALEQALERVRVNDRLLEGMRGEF